MSGVLYAGRRLDYVPRLDERNLAHRVGAAAPGLLAVSRFWTPGVVLDQGQEGSCVGHGVTGEWLASPVRGRVDLVNRSTWTPAARSSAEVGHLIAVDVYNRAKQVDEWEGVDYDGTSVRAGMLVGRERGWYTGFRWALTMAELRAALEEGPVVIGVEWRKDSYDAPGGIMRVTGPVVGGHCVSVTGYTPKHPAIGGPAYRILNSWGPSFGVSGSAYVAAEGLKSILFDAGGEAAVPVGRRL